MSTTTMLVSPRYIVQRARAHNWSAKQLSAVLKGMPEHTIQSLLDGSAIVTEEYDDGTFDVYDTRMVLV